MSRSALRESARKASDADRYDVFLSHASEDADLVYGVKLELERFGYSTYVDWIDDPQLDRTHVNFETAHLLRTRMRQCISLAYVATANAPQSLWMPWELGYFDGFGGRSTVLPVVDIDSKYYEGIEYLGLYPYIDDYNDQDGKRRLWVNEPGSDRVYAPLRTWLRDTSAMRERGPW